jgi:hypothetical protein
MLDWCQEEPNCLVHASIDGPRKVLTRGSPWLSEAAKRAARIPPGHPEGFLEAFANIYRGVAADIHARLTGASADPIDADYPGVEAGARGVRFIEKTVESARSERKWVSMG